MNAAALEAALRAAGLPCVVEGRDALAVVTVPGSRSRFADDDVRLRTLALAREHGFTHLALELLDAEERAPVPGD